MFPPYGTGVNPAYFIGKSFGLREKKACARSISRYRRDVHKQAMRIS